MTNVGPSSLRQLAAAAAGQNAHPTNPASSPGDRLYMAGCYKNMYAEWTTALSEATQGPLNLTLLMKEVTAEVCFTPVAEGDLLLGKDDALMEVTSDGKRLNLDTREICVATEDEFPIGRVDQLYRKTVERLNPHFDVHFDPTENRLITIQHLSMLQQRALKQYENEALETIWNRKLAEEFNLQNNPDLQTHEQIRAWLNDPNNAQQLQQITLLELSQLGLKTLPPEIGAFTNLQRLNLDHNQLHILPPEIGALTNLQTLSLDHNQLHTLPSEIGALTNLHTLSLDHNQLHTIPSEIGTLTNLHTLSINNNKLRSLPSEIGALSNLQQLDLSNNQLHSLPSEIGDLGRLQRLKLFINQLCSLPAEIGNLSNLLELTLWSNQLSSLPPEIGNLSNLEKLSASHNQLRSLPPEIGALGNLQTIYLYSNKLCSLPPEIGALKNLQGLYLNNNELHSIPSEIGKLGRLTELNLCDNQLRSLPSEITVLTHVRMLALTNNQLCSLPSEMGAMRGLQWLYRDNNPWIFISDQELAKGPSIATFFRLNKEFMEYPTQSSLGNLFQLIARGEDAATIQNTFEELDSELQNRIIALANGDLLIPVAASSNWTLGADENLFTDMPRLSRAVKQATDERCENLSTEQKKRLIYELADKAKGDPERAEDDAFSNILHFVDALEKVVSSSLLNEEPASLSL